MTGKARSGSQPAGADQDESSDEPWPEHDDAWSGSDGTDVEADPYGEPAASDPYGEAPADGSWATGPDAPATPEDEAPHVTLRPSPVRITIQAVLAVIGIGIFAYLVVLLDRSADPGALALVLVGLLVVILVAEVLLVESVYRRLVRVPAPLPEPGEEDNYVLGCPGCGTVFSLTESDMEGGEFECRNCGRQGFIGDRDLNKQEIREERCENCGATYLEYKEHSECPECHTFNAY